MSALRFNIAFLLHELRFGRQVRFAGILIDPSTRLDQAAFPFRFEVICAGPANLQAWYDDWQ